MRLAQISACAKLTSVCAKLTAAAARLRFNALERFAQTLAVLTERMQERVCVT